MGGRRCWGGRASLCSRGPPAAPRESCPSGEHSTSFDHGSLVCLRQLWCAPMMPPKKQAGHACEQLAAATRH
eukprot:14515002-Alexandrium_andersonii.AAC.1